MNYTPFNISKELLEPLSNPEKDLLMIPNAESIEKLFGVTSKRYYALRDSSELELEVLKDKENIMKLYPKLCFETFSENLEKIVTEKFKKISYEECKDAIVEILEFLRLYENSKMKLLEKIYILSRFEFNHFKQLISKIGYSQRDSKLFKSQKSIASAISFFDQDGTTFFHLVKKLESVRMYFTDLKTLIRNASYENLGLLMLRYDYKPEYKNSEVQIKLNLKNKVRSEFSFETFKTLFSIESERFNRIRGTYCLMKQTHRVMALRCIIDGFKDNDSDFFQNVFDYGNLILVFSFSEEEYSNFIFKLESFLKILNSYAGSKIAAASIIGFDVKFLEIVAEKLTANKKEAQKKLYFKILKRIANLKEISSSYIEGKMNRRVFYSELALQSSFITNFILACKLAGYRGFPYVVWRYGMEVKF